jgi:IMP dehydrogenase/GMP reductase
MNMFSPQMTYTYDDIGLVPLDYSDIDSRDDIDISVDFGNFSLDVPVLLAPMETVVDSTVAKIAWRCGSVAVLPRRAYSSTTDMDEYNNTVTDTFSIAIPSIPAKGDNLKELIRYYLDHEYPSDYICIDVANGYHKAVDKTIDLIRQVNEETKIIVGNIASEEAFGWYTEQDVYAVRVGIGNGSACTTSLATGIGVGQASLIRELASGEIDDGPLIIADGGIKQPADVVKAIALGADVVMAGGFFARAEDSPGRIKVIDGEKYKVFSGQASTLIKQNNRYIEGITTQIPVEGTIESQIQKIKDGLRSAMSYMNCTKIKELKHLPDEYFVRLSGASQQERLPYVFR